MANSYLKHRLKELQGDAMFCLRLELKAPFTLLKLNLEWNKFFFQSNYIPKIYCGSPYAISYTAACFFLHLIHVFCAMKYIMFEMSIWSLWLFHISSNHTSQGTCGFCHPICSLLFSIFYWILRGDSWFLSENNVIIKAESHFSLNLKKRISWLYIFISSHLFPNFLVSIHCR